LPLLLFTERYKKALKTLEFFRIKMAIVQKLTEFLKERRDRVERSIEGIVQEALVETVTEGQIIVDFGCGSGTYTLPAAKLVGEEGKVYALDKNKKALDKLMKKAEAEGLKNIERIDTSGAPKIPLEDESVHVVLLYDVFNEYYFPSAGARRELLDEIHRILKPNGILSVWLRRIEPEKAKNELGNANFYLTSEYSKILIQGDVGHERGEILNFRK